MTGNELRKRLFQMNIELKNISDTLGKSPQWLNSKLKSKNLSLSFLEDVSGAINKTVDELVGEHMKPSPQGDSIRLQKATGEREKKKVPILGEAAASTEIEMNTTETPYPMQYIDVGDLLRDSEAAFTVYGNSMTANYSAGSVLGLKRCYDSFIQPGECYVIVTKSNRVFKRLYWNEDKTAYVCHSDNTMIHETGPRKGKPYYEPFEIPLKEVIALYDVTGVIRRTRNSGIIERVV